MIYVYFEDEPGRRSAAKLLSKDEARRIAANIKLKVRAAHSAPRLPSLSPRMVYSCRCSCRCVVQEAELVFERLCGSASVCRNSGNHAVLRFRRPCLLLKAELKDGIDLDQWSNGAITQTPIARNEDRTRRVSHLADRQRGPLRAGRASGPGYPSPDSSVRGHTGAATRLFKPQFLNSGVREQ